MYTGIIHIAPKPGAKPICGKRNAILSAPLADHSPAERCCARCLAKWNKWEAIRAKRAATAALAARVASY